MKRTAAALVAVSAAFGNVAAADAPEGYNTVDLTTIESTTLSNIDGIGSLANLMASGNHDAFDPANATFFTVDNKGNMPYTLYVDHDKSGIIEGDETRDANGIMGGGFYADIDALIFKRSDGSEDVVRIGRGSAKDKVETIYTSLTSPQNAAQWILSLKLHADGSPSVQGFYMNSGESAVNIMAVIPDTPQPGEQSLVPIGFYNFPVEDRKHDPMSHIKPTDGGVDVGGGLGVLFEAIEKAEEKKAEEARPKGLFELIFGN